MESIDRHHQFGRRSFSRWVHSFSLQCLSSYESKYRLLFRPERWLSFHPSRSYIRTVAQTRTAMIKFHQKWNCSAIVSQRFVFRFPTRCKWAVLMRFLNRPLPLLYEDSSFWRVITSDGHSLSGASGGCIFEHDHGISPPRQIFRHCRSDLSLSE